MVDELNKRFTFVLGSKSPRRKELLDQLGLKFSLRSSAFEEVMDGEMEAHLVPEHFAVEKALDLMPSLKEDELLITADTDVILEGNILGKAANGMEAQEMLRSLSGKWHEVTTGMCLTTLNQSKAFSETTKVKFKELTAAEMDHYIQYYRPFDKAGAYGIQEWIGLIGVEGIEGCFFNVIGLPIPRFYKELSNFTR